MPEILLTGEGGVLSAALSVVTVYGPYLMIGLAFVVAPRLLKLGQRTLRGGR